MNVYDSDKISSLLKTSLGLEMVADPKDATVFIVNTCSVRDKAQQKLYSELGRWRKFKETCPDAIIGVGGCVASQEGGEILARAPYVDVVFGPQTLHRLPSLIRKARENSKPEIDISFPEIENLIACQSKRLKKLRFTFL